MKKPSAALSAILLISSLNTAFAASSVDLSVQGLITPSACTATLSQGGTADYGKLPAKELNVDIATPLPDATLQMRVECEGATLFAFNGVDNRAGSSIADDATYGLGLINEDERVGAYWLTFIDPLADGAKLTKLDSSDSGATWQANLENGLWRRSHLAAFGTESNGTWAPVPIAQLVSQLRITTFIAASRNLTLTQEQPIDGSATLELRYL